MFYTLGSRASSFFQNIYCVPFRATSRRHCCATPPCRLILVSIKTLFFIVVFDHSRISNVNLLFFKLWILQYLLNLVVHAYKKYAARASQNKFTFYKALSTLHITFQILLSFKNTATWTEGLIHQLVYNLKNVVYNNKTNFRRVTYNKRKRGVC